MQKLRTVIIGIAVAVLLSYIISSIYARYRYPVSLSEGQPSGKSVCVYEDGQYDLMDVEEYIESVLMGMMQDDWNEEMLKAMAVVLRTGVYYQMENQDTSQTGKNDLINESELREIRYTYAELKENGGTSTETWQDVHMRQCQTQGALPSDMMDRSYCLCIT